MMPNAMIAGYPNAHHGEMKEQYNAKRRKCRAVPKRRKPDPGSGESTRDAPVVNGRRHEYSSFTSSFEACIVPSGVVCRAQLTSPARLQRAGCHVQARCALTAAPPVFSCFGEAPRMPLSFSRLHASRSEKSPPGYSGGTPFAVYYHECPPSRLAVCHAGCCRCRRCR